MSGTVLPEPLPASLGEIREPGELLAEIFRRWGRRAAIGTSGQLSGSVLIDAAVRAGATPRVFTIDTGRLFPETHELFDRIERRYGIRIERHAPDPDAVARMVAEHGEYLFFDSRVRQELCCRVRKVIPNEAVLASLDVWITGLRADQSAERRSTTRLARIPRPEGEGTILKVAPLAGWSEQEVRRYARENGVPVHPLLEREHAGGWRYASIGCVTCTTPVGPGESSRAGRWRWFAGGAKECGLHKEGESHGEG